MVYAAERIRDQRPLHSNRFTDLAEVWAILLDEGIYLGSESTFYRLLRAAGETRERRRQATHPAAVKPELVATAPNQVWSWDREVARPREMDVLLLVRDLGHLLPLRRRLDAGQSRNRFPGRGSHREQTCIKQRIGRGQLSLHADRGSSMTSKPVAFLLADLGVTQSHRPHVSNDNPFVRNDVALQRVDSQIGGGLMSVV